MTDRLVSSAAAAARLGVKRATVYAYVSRGLLTARQLRGRQGSWFDPVELDTLTRRARHPAERRPELRIASAVTLIDGGRFWYRGRVPDQLAASAGYERVAELLWTGDLPDQPPRWAVDRRAVSRARRALDTLPDSASIQDRLRVAVAVLGAHDALRFDLRPPGALATSRRLVGGTVAALTGRATGTVAARVAALVSPKRPVPAAIRAVETALILLADHELAASTLAARVAASFRADPYAAVSAGLGAVAGTWHGAASRRVESALAGPGRARDPERVLGELLHDGRVVPGFGHPLYPDGDPRVTTLLRLARSMRKMPDVDAVLALAAARGVPHPNVDFALAALSRALRLRPGAGEALFAMARLAGWLAHAMEEYAEPTPIRQRAVYTGPQPE